MTDDNLQALRASGGYKLGRAALRVLERYAIAPTPVAYHLGARVVLDPEGALALEFAQRFCTGAPASEADLQDLASRHLVGPFDEVEISNVLTGLNRETELFLGEVRQDLAANQEFVGFLESLAGIADVEAADRLRLRLSDQVAIRAAFAVNLTEAASVVSELMEYIARATAGAEIDGLTQLPNRRSFDKTFELQLAAGEPLALVILDVDRFKLFNDTWGHQTGDQVLRFVGEVIRKNIPIGTSAARFGGEEFTILLPGELAKDAAHVADLVRLAIRSRAIRKRGTNEELGVVTVSAGVAVRAGDEPGEALIERSDQALYHSKRDGRDRLTIADDPPASASA